jgi:hypothetical protein
MPAGITGERGTYSSSGADAIPQHCGLVMSAAPPRGRRAGTESRTSWWRRPGRSCRWDRRVGPLPPHPRR